MARKEEEVDIYAIGEVTTEYAFKLKYLLDTFDLYDENGIFTFPDGDVWEK
jgi:hypothetical protein